jgi:hypothetical protein
MSVEINDRNIERLWRNVNDSGELGDVKLDLNYFDYRSLWNCVGALHYNTTAKCLKLESSEDEDDTSDAEPEDWVRFWNKISIHPVLEKLELSCTPHSANSLAAIARSSSIKTVIVKGTIVSINSLNTFLRTTTSVTALVLRPNRLEGILNNEELAHSIAQNTSIDDFNFSWWGPPSYDHLEAVVLHGLALNTRIQRFVVNNMGSRHLTGREELAEADLFRLALTGTEAPLKHLEFGCADFKEEWFPVVLQGIRDSRYVRQISLDYCSLDEGSTRLLLELFTTPTVKRYVFCVKETLDVSGTTTAVFLGDLLRLNVCMSELRLVSCENQDETLVPTIAAALENDPSSVLESLTLSIAAHSQLRVLVGCLPKMKHLRKLDVTLRATDIPDRNAMLLQMLKRNSSLWQVTANLGEDWTEADTAAMQFCAKRNKKIHAILTAPSKTVQKLLMHWPRVFVEVRGCEAEASIILLVLTAVGESVGQRDPECPITKRHKRAKAGLLDCEKSLDNNGRK